MLVYISLFSFLDFTWWIQSGELYGTVNSIRIIALALVITISGRAEVPKISAGIVLRGFQQLSSKEGQHKSLSPCCRHFLTRLTRFLRAWSCLQVYLPCARATGHPFNMWWIVGQGLSQRRHLASVLILHRHKFNGVGSVSDPALSKKDTCPAGNPFWMRFPMLFWDASSVMVENLCWTVNSPSLSF